MRTVSAIIACIALTTTGAAMLFPVGNALDVGCTQASPGTPTVIATPPGALVANFFPECVIVKNGDVITFAGIDADPHQPVIPDAATKAGMCFDAGLLVTGLHNTLKLTVDDALATSATVGFKGGLASAAVPPVPATRDCDTEAVNLIQKGSALEPSADIQANVFSYDDAANQMIVHFICNIHGPVMHGVIKVQL